MNFIYDPFTIRKPIVMAKWAQESLIRGYSIPAATHAIAVDKRHSKDHMLADAILRYTTIV